MNNYIGNLAGDIIDDILLKSSKFVDYNIIPSNSDLNDYTTPGIYVCESGAIAATIANVPYNSASFTLIVLPLYNISSALHQIVIANDDRCFYYRKKGWNGSIYTFFGWLTVNFTNITVNTQRKGPTSSRPVLGANARQKDVSIGFCYIDETLGNKPVFYTGDTSGGKTGWVDATGANV